MEAASSRCIQYNSRARGSEIPAQSAKGEERGDHERNSWLAKMIMYLLYHISKNFSQSRIYHFIKKIECQIFLRHNFSEFDNYIINYIKSKLNVLLVIHNFSELNTFAKNVILLLL